jgi:hypothetical protein
MAASSPLSATHRAQRTAHRDLRICIVGAGASGLATAHALRRRGYGRVTVLEREPRVGGKCFTVKVDGRSYEMGAAALSLRYRNVWTLMLETRMTPSLALAGAFIDVDGRADGKVQRRLPLPSPFGWRDVAPQAARMTRELWRHRAIRRPGFQDVPPELCAPFADWSRARGVELMGEFIKPLVTGFGYGFYREVPAAYVLKYANLLTVPLFELRDGYGALWERVARSLAGVSIRTGTTIDRIERSDEQVRVHTDQGSFDFDALVLSCPLDGLAALLDVTPVEAELFSRIRLYDYYVVAAQVEGLPQVRTLFFPRALEPEQRGAPMLAYQRWPGRGLTCFYGFAADGPDEAAAREVVCTTVARLGGRVRAIELTKCWRYFPHVCSADMAAGFYGRLEGLQGERATYYCGELLALGTVETTVAYANAMVARYFPAAE